MMRITSNPDRFFQKVTTTMGFGDIAPVSWEAKLIVIAEIVTSFFIFSNFYNLKRDRQPIK